MIQKELGRRNIATVCQKAGTRARGKKNSKEREERGMCKETDTDEREEWETKECKSY